MVGLGLLLAGLDLVHGAGFQLLALLLGAGQAFQVVLVSLLRQREPVHHIPGVVDLEERLDLVPDGVLHLHVQGIVQGLAGDRLQVFGDPVDVVVDEDGGAVQRELRAARVLPEAAVVGDQVREVLRMTSPFFHFRSMAT